MARRPSVASLDSGMYSPEYGGESLMTGQGAPATKPLWSGNGGRWLLWPLRIVLWAAILIIDYRGISAIVLSESPTSSNDTGATPALASSAFPITRGMAFVLQFGQVYLNFSPNYAPERARKLARTMQLDSEQAVSVGVRSARTAVVTILATVHGSLIELGVPVYASDFGSIASITAPPAGATRDITVTVNWVLYGQVSPAAPQLAATYDMSVIDKPGGRWYVREIRASTQPMGTQ